MVKSTTPCPIDDERQLRLLATIVRDQAICLLDQDGRVSGWNDGARRLEGHQAQDIVGQSFSRFFAPEDRVAGLPEQALRLAREKGRYEMESWRVRRSGERYWAQTIIEAIRGDHGRICGFAQVVREVSARHHEAAATRSLFEPVIEDIPAPTEEEATAASAPADAPRPRILLAEDHPMNQKVVQMMLGDGVDLQIAADGAQAVEAVRLQPYDLILMDSQMPVMDGLAAMRAIRQIERELGRPRTPIVSLTGNALDHQVEASAAAGADYHLAKPITMQGLLQTVRRALEQSEASASQQPIAAPHSRRA